MTKKKRQMQLENSTVPVYIKFIFHVLNKLIGDYELSLNVLIFLKHDTIKNFKADLMTFFGHFQISRRP